MTQESSNIFEKMKLINLFAQPIVPFDGNSANLTRFINHCDRFNSRFASNDALLNEAIIDIIKSKLIGNASEIVSSNERITANWRDLRKFLKLKFEEKISLTVLFWDLQNAQRLRNENDLDFLEKIVDLKNKYDYQVELSDLSITEKEQEKNIASRVATRVLLYNINPELRTALRGHGIMNYDDMVNFIRQDFYYYQQPFLHYKNQISQKSNIQNPRRQPPTNEFHTTRINNDFQSQRNYPNHNRFQQNHQNFPSQPIQLQQRIVNRHFPTNQQVFGPSTSTRQTNVFKPNPNQRLQNPPEKMSIQTRNFPQKRQNYSTQYQVNPQRKFPFQNQGNNYQNPNFTFEELTHIEPALDSLFIDDNEPQNYSEEDYENDQSNPDNYHEENFPELAEDNSLT